MPHAVGGEGYRPRFFGTNLKMHQTAHESARFIEGLAQSNGDGVQRFVIPPFTSLPGIVASAHATNIWVGAQNMHWEQSGEFTGEISAGMLRALDVDLVLVGHAERRRMFGDDDAAVRRKVEAGLACGLRVLLCVGDTADEHRCGASIDVVLRQVRLALSGISDRSRVIVAYEPVWAIGERGTPATADDIVPVAGALSAWLGATPLLYGGSVNAQTARDFAAIDGIAGLFVGRAAWTPDGFVNVLQAAAMHAAHP
jgi:triosephosphate isomerase